MARGFLCAECVSTSNVLAQFVLVDGWRHVRLGNVGVSLPLGSPSRLCLACHKVMMDDDLILPAEPWTDWVINRHPIV